MRISSVFSILLFVVALAWLCWGGLSLHMRMKAVDAKGNDKQRGYPLFNKAVILIPLGESNSLLLVKSTYQKLKVFLPQLQLRETVALPRMAFYPARNRYRSDSLIAWMSRMAKQNEVYIGITDVDISTTKGSHTDWGVMGLAYSPGSAAVASSFRMKNKAAFWKVAIHELGHTTGLPHCPVKTCFMRDADGGDPTSDEREFCSKCKAVLVQNGWKL